MKPEDGTDDFSVVSENPAEFYSSPEDILLDKRVSNEERLRLLEEWHTDISNKLTADEEGMTPESPLCSADDADLLKEIARAREKIDQNQMDDRDSVEGGIVQTVARIWHRLTDAKASRVPDQTTEENRTDPMNMDNAEGAARAMATDGQAMASRHAVVTGLAYGLAGVVAYAGLRSFLRNH
jgi:hypothetical protein